MLETLETLPLRTRSSAPKFFFWSSADVVYDLASRNFMESAGMAEIAETEAETEADAEESDESEADERHEELRTELGDEGTSSAAAAGAPAVTGPLPLGSVASSWLIGGSDTFCMICLCGGVRCGAVEKERGRERDDDDPIYHTVKENGALI